MVCASRRWCDNCQDAEGVGLVPLLIRAGTTMVELLEYLLGRRGETTIQFNSTTIGVALPIFSTIVSTFYELTLAARLSLIPFHPIVSSSLRSMFHLMTSQFTGNLPHRLVLLNSRTWQEAFTIELTLPQPRTWQVAFTTGLTLPQPTSSDVDSWVINGQGRSSFVEIGLVASW
ncbi:hypothetical protein B296_00011681 [Ensete ventricosum]|uniref:Uncharacterized protein n=1 Tax=Ensete ventricosum TaxID=4639 RepID=A0A426Z7C7_ENSVE|nr:hypothetical protein B296_00011681 [Ensete ventricosum]